MGQNKQTAVEWLVEQLLPKALSAEQYYHIEQAKEMEKEQDKFTNAPIHDKKAIIEMMNELHPKEMIEVVEFIKSKIKNMENNKQSSVEWLIKKLQNREKGIFDGVPHLSLDEIYNQAKAMHKEEIIKSCNAGLSGIPRSAKQYYEQEYGKQ